MKKLLSLVFLFSSLNLFGYRDYYDSSFSISNFIFEIIIMILIFIPSILAYGKKNGKTILLLTVFLGWTLIIPLILFILVIIEIYNEHTSLCPYCKERIKKDAIVCKHCQKNLTEQK